jgi:UDP-N-acetylmuramoyl-tripeptide--D-alanyl-D-alanine ligase
VVAGEVQVGSGLSARIAAGGEEERFEFPFTETYNLTNALAAIAGGIALGASLRDMAVRAAGIGFSRFRGEQIKLAGGILLVNDCYNANPVSMRAALDQLSTLGGMRTLAVLGGMGELGPGSAGYHQEVGDYARGRGIDYVLGVGAMARDYGPDELVADPGEAAEWLESHLEEGDVVLIKGSRSVGMEAIAKELAEEAA